MLVQTSSTMRSDHCGVQMRREIALLSTIALAGCLPDQTKDVATCRTEAERFYPMYNVVDPADPSSQFIIACMATKGYDFTVSPKDCDSRYPFATQSTCYAPNSWPGWTIYQLRRAQK
jgi:hypothetical protein